LRLKRLATIFLLLISFPGFARPDFQTPADTCRFVTAANLSDPEAPRFDSYPVLTEEKVPNPKLDLSSNPIAERYRTVLRYQVSEGLNFAGHYRVAIWGCGMTCAMFAVVNLKTGQVITPKRASTVLGIHVAADDFLPNAETGGRGFRYTTRSNLLVLVGMLDEDESRDGAFYFVLQNEKLIPIHSTIVKKSCENVNP
jgi:hypothetical protein